MFTENKFLSLWYDSSNSAYPDKTYTSRLISPLTTFNTHQCLQFYYSKTSSSLVVTIQLVNGTEIDLFRDKWVGIMSLWTKISITVPKYEEVSMYLGQNICLGGQTQLLFLSLKYSLHTIMSIICMEKDQYLKIILLQYVSFIFNIVPSWVFATLTEHHIHYWFQQ